MDTLPIPFTEDDKNILESYKLVAEGLSLYLGNCYEVVIHSFESLENSVVKIFNNHSGRKEGSPITDLGLKMLSIISENPDFNNMTYFNKDVQGKPLKSCTIALRGKSNRVIGMLCINFYMDTSLYDFMQTINPDNMSKPDTVSETFAENVDDLVLERLSVIRNNILSDISVSAVNRNKEIVTALYSEGLFNLKDAVLTVSKALGISKNTVYMHIRNQKN